VRRLIRGRPAPPCILDALLAADRKHERDQIKTLIFLGAALLVMFFMIYFIANR
jgi:hypothetical protein